MGIVDFVSKVENISKTEARNLIQSNGIRICLLDKFEMKPPAININNSNPEDGWHWFLRGRTNSWLVWLSGSSVIVLDPAGSLKFWWVGETVLTQIQSPLKDINRKNHQFIMNNLLGNFHHNGITKELLETVKGRAERDCA